MALAPIILFVYNRPWHTLQTLEALSRNDQAADSVLHVFSDGPKANASEEVLRDISEVRSIVRSRKWCGQVHVTEYGVNRGLARSVIEGVTSSVDRFGKVIVLEDDIVTSPQFLPFMNEALSVYEDHPSVMSVTGYAYPIKGPSPADPETFLIRGGISCWGWGTWARAWKCFEPDATVLMAQVARLNRRQFNWNNSIDYLGMLQAHITGRNDSWGVRWYSSVYLQQGLGLFPSRSLVRNIGFDGTGIHCGTNEAYGTALLYDGPIRIQPGPIVHNRRMFEKITGWHAPSLFERFKAVPAAMRCRLKSLVTARW